MAEEGIPGEAEHPALALVNTVLRRHGGELDLIAGPSEAGRWLTGHLRRLAGEAPSMDGAGLAALGELRGAIREVFRARVAGERPAGDAVATVNRAAGLAPVVPVLRWSGSPDAESGNPVRESGSQEREPGRGGRLVRGSEPVGGTAFERALAALAGDAIAVVTGGEALAECGAPDCIRFLVRTHGKRQWCSTRCGDRVRAARHYARTHRS